MADQALIRRIAGDNANTTRVAEIKLAREYYNGDYFASRTRASRGREATRNYVELLVDTVTSYLGTPNISWGDTAAEGAHEEVLAYVSEEDSLSQRDAETETAAAVDGDGCWKVTYDDRAHRPRVTPVDPTTLWLGVAPDDPQRIETVAQVLRLGPADSPVMFAGQVLQLTAPSRMVEVWDATSWEIWHGDQLVHREPNPYNGALPYVVWPNRRRPWALWGTADVTRQMRDIGDLLNEGERDTDTLVRLHGTIVTISGASDSGDLTVTPGSIWELPEGAKAEVLDLLKGNAIGQRIAYLDHLRETMNALARVPSSALGGGSNIPQNISGLALQVQLGPIARLIAAKRRSRTIAYQRRARLIATLAALFDGLPPPPDHAAQVTWSEPLPSDRTVELANASAELALGRPVEAVLRSIGVSDPPAEIAQRLAETARGIAPPMAGPPAPAPGGPQPQ